MSDVMMTREHLEAVRQAYTDARRRGAEFSLLSETSRAFDRQAIRLAEVAAHLEQQMEKDA